MPGLENEGGISTVVHLDERRPARRRADDVLGRAATTAAHGGTAVDGPRTRWLFAEGSQGFFNTFVLLANANASRGRRSTLDLPARRRQPVVTGRSRCRRRRACTVAAGAIPELVGQSFSIVVDATHADHRRARDVLRHRARSSTAATNRPASPTAPTRGSSPKARPARSSRRSCWSATRTRSAANVTLHVPAPTTARRSCGSKSVPAEQPPDRSTSKPSRSGARQRRGVHHDRVRQPRRRRARDVLAGTAVARWAEAHNSFGVDRPRRRGGAWPRAASAGPRASRPTSCWRTPATTAARTSRSRSCAPTASTVVKTFTVAPTSRFNVGVSSGRARTAERGLRGA